MSFYAYYVVTCDEKFHLLIVLDVDVWWALVGFC